MGKRGLSDTSDTGIAFVICCRWAKFLRFGAEEAEKALVKEETRYWRSRYQALETYSKALICLNDIASFPAFVHVIEEKQPHLTNLVMTYEADITRLICNYASDPIAFLADCYCNIDNRKVRHVALEMFKKKVKGITPDELMERYGFTIDDCTCHVHEDEEDPCDHDCDNCGCDPVPGVYVNGSETGCLYEDFRTSRHHQIQMIGRGSYCPALY